MCLGTDPLHTPPEPAETARTAFAVRGGTGLDSPFAGTCVPGGPAGPGLDRLAAAPAALVDAP